MSALSWRKTGLGICLTLLLLIFPSAFATAQQPGLHQKFRSGGTITVSAGETVPHDLYIWGGTVRIDGRIEGDLFVAGGTVNVTGPVAGDLFAAGGEVTISGTIAGDLRVAGGTVTVSGPVSEDLLAGAGQFTLSSTARVGQDLIFGTGQTTLNGTVGGGVLGSTGNYIKGGSIAGREEVHVQQPPEERRPNLGQRFLDQVRRYLTIVLFGALLLWLAPRATQSAATLARERPLPSFGVGILTVVGLVIVLIALLLAAIIVAIPLGILGFGRLVLTALLGALLSGSVLIFIFLLAVFFVANAIVGLTIGRLLLGRTGIARSERGWEALLAGVLLIVILTAIPVIGGILNVISVLLGLGALALAGQRWRQARPPRAT